MVEKGLLRIEMVHGAKTFLPIISKLETLAALANDFARNILDSTAPVPVATFVNSSLVSPDEIAELEQLLKNLAASNGDKL